MSKRYVSEVYHFILAFLSASFARVVSLFSKSFMRIVEDKLKHHFEYQGVVHVNFLFFSSSLSSLP